MRKGIDFIAVTEWVIWVTIALAVVGSLRASPLRALALIPAAIAASWLLRRADMPPAWRVLGAVLLAVAWVLGVSILTGAFDPPRGL